MLSICCILYSFCCLAQQEVNQEEFTKNEINITSKTTAIESVDKIVSYYVEERINSRFGSNITTYNLSSLRLLDTSDLGRYNVRIVTPIFSKSSSKIKGEPMSIADIKGVITKEKEILTLEKKRLLANQMNLRQVCKKSVIISSNPEKFAFETDQKKSILSLNQQTNNQNKVTDKIKFKTQLNANALVNAETNSNSKKAVNSEKLVSNKIKSNQDDTKKNNDLAFNNPNELNSKNEINNIDENSKKSKSENLLVDIRTTKITAKIEINKRGAILYKNDSVTHKNSLIDKSNLVLAEQKKAINRNESISITASKNDKDFTANAIKNKPKVVLSNEEMSIVNRTTYDNDANAITSSKPSIYVKVDVLGAYERILEKGYESPNMLKWVGDKRYYDGDLVIANQWYSKLFNITTDFDPDYYFRYYQCLKATNQVDKANQILAKFESLKMKK